MVSRCLTLSAVAAMLALALGSPLAAAEHTPLSGPPFTLRVDALATSVLPGENATWNVTVGNPGLLPRDASLSLATSLPAGWTYQLAQTMSVPNGGNASATLTVFVPEDAGAQQLTFVVEASDEAHFTRENATVTVRARPAASESGDLPAPELSITVSTGDAGPSGELVAGELVIRNVDPFGRAVGVEVRPVPRDGWQPYVGAVNNRIIPAGDFRVISLFVRVPDLAENVTKTFDVSIVPTQGAVRTAQWTVQGIAPQPLGAGDGNAASSQPTGATTSTTTGGGSGAAAPAVFGPNLDVFVEPVEVEVTSGATRAATVRLVNTGSTPLTVRLVGETPQTWPLSAFAFDPAQAISLAPNEETRIDMTISAPAGIPVGGRSTGAVSALAEGGLARRATFQIRIVDAVPSDTSNAAGADVPVAPGTPGGLDGPATLVVVGLAAVGAGAALVASRPLREKLLWGAAGLYTRLARPDVLGHEDREKLYRLVETQPGIHFHALQRDLGWNTGTLTYHLRVLEKHGFMVSRRDGLYRRFYLSGAAPRKEVFENQGPTGLRADVLEAVRTQPGISQSDLALGLSANKQTVNYHVKALERAGTIRVEKRGRDTYLYPGDGIPTGAPAAPPQDRARV